MHNETCVINVLIWRQLDWLVNFVGIFCQFYQLIVLGPLDSSLRTTFYWHLFKPYFQVFSELLRLKITHRLFLQIADWLTEQSNNIVRFLNGVSDALDHIHRLNNLTPRSSMQSSEWIIFLPKHWFLAVCPNSLQDWSCWYESFARHYFTK